MWKFEIYTSWNSVNRVVDWQTQKNTFVNLRISVENKFSVNILVYASINQCICIPVYMDLFMCGHQILSGGVKSFNTTAKITFTISIGLPSFSNKSKKQQHIHKGPNIHIIHIHTTILIQKHTKTLLWKHSHIIYVMLRLRTACSSMWFLFNQDKHRWNFLG